MAKDHRNLLQRLRVPLGFIVFILFLVLSRPTWLTLLIGLPISVIGLFIRGWASGHLQKNAELTTTGPYAHTRNPLYFGSFLMTAGAAIGGGQLTLAVGLVLLFLLIYYPVMRAEAKLMQQLFAAKYESWSKAVPLFLPSLMAFRLDDQRRFAIELYLKHREYRAAIGTLILYAVLAVKIGIKHGFQI